MATYANSLRDLLQNPGTFTSSPGFDFARDQALQATSRSAAAGGMRGSGNVLAALSRQASGMASQDYGNQVDRMQRAAGMEQEGDLSRERMGLDRDLGMGQLGLGWGRLGLDRETSQGQLGLGWGRLGLDDKLGSGQLQLGQDRLGLDRDMGTEQNRLLGIRDQNQYALGMGGLDQQRRSGDQSYDLGLLGAGNTATRNLYDYNLGWGGLDQQRRQGDQSYGLGMYRAGNDYDLGQQQNWNTANNNWWNYQNGMDRNAIDQYGAQTQRGTALSNSYGNWWGY